MIGVKQHFYSDDEPRTLDFYKTHYFSETGHFEYKTGDMKSKPCGWHLELGTSSRITKYTEVDDGEKHEVPESLEDMVIHIEPEEDTQAEPTAEGDTNEVTSSED
jgi:hypothetical protein